MAHYTLTQHTVYHIPTAEFLDMLIQDRPDWDEAIDAGEDEFPGSAYLLGPEDCPADLAETFVLNGLVYDGTRMDGYDSAMHHDLLHQLDGIYWRGFPKQQKALFAYSPAKLQTRLTELGI